MGPLTPKPLRQTPPMSALQTLYAPNTYTVMLSTNTRYAECLVTNHYIRQNQSLWSKLQSMSHQFYSSVSTPDDSRSTNRDHSPVYSWQNMTQMHWHLWYEAKHTSQISRATKSLFQHKTIICHEHIRAILEPSPGLLAPGPGASTGIHASINKHLAVWPE